MNAPIIIPPSAITQVDDTMQAWAKRWLARWKRAGGRAVIDSASVLHLSHRPPLHMSRQRQAETTPAIAATILSELQGTVGGHRAVAALVLRQQANDAAVCRSDPDSALVISARAWLDAYREAGGSWIGTDERPQLLMATGADVATLRRMQDDLFADAQLAHAVRGQIVKERWDACALPASEVEGC